MDHELPDEATEHPSLSIAAFKHDSHFHVTTHLETSEMSLMGAATMLREIADVWESQYVAAIASTN